MSTFESLPNEILIELFERYMNLFDIINGFALQLNRRIDALIFRCQRFHLNFNHCRKDQFRFVRDRLTSYVDRIEDLVLDDYNIPCISISFFSVYPSLEPFQNLRRLYIRTKNAAFNSTWLYVALDSLSKTNVVELDLKASLFLFADQSDIYFQKLERLALSERFEQISASTFPHLQSLTLVNIYYTHIDLDRILKYAPLLKYLHIKVAIDKNANDVLLPLDSSSLESWLVHLDEYSIFPWDLLQRYFQAMPKLRHLELTGNENFFDATNWEELLNGFLRNLTKLYLHFIVASISEQEICNRLELFQTSFWIAKENFRILIKERVFLGIEKSRPLFANLPVDHCWIGPRRNGLIPENHMRTLVIRNKSLSFTPYQKFDQLNTLIIQDLNDNLITMVKNAINLSRIQHLTVSLDMKQIQRRQPFLNLFSNLVTLRVQLQILFYLSDDCSILSANLHSLDLSNAAESFEEDDIQRIQKLFPNLKHLIIKAQHLRWMPMLISRLSNLCTLKCLPSFGVNSASTYMHEWLHEMVRLLRQSNISCDINSRSFVYWVDHDSSKINE